jgi:hypothetical protein
MANGGRSENRRYGFLQKMKITMTYHMEKVVCYAKGLPSACSGQMGVSQCPPTRICVIPASIDPIWDLTGLFLASEVLFTILLLSKAYPH